MARIAIDPDAREHVRTDELRDESIWGGTVTFDPETGTSQEVDDDVAQQFVDEYDGLRLASEIDEGDAPPVDELEAVLSGTVGEVEDALETGDYDDRLDALEAHERDGADRTTVYEAIDDRRDARDSDDDSEEA